MGEFKSALEGKKVRGRVYISEQVGGFVGGGNCSSSPFMAERVVSWGGEL